MLLTIIIMTKNISEDRYSIYKVQPDVKAKGSSSREQCRITHDPGGEPDTSESAYSR